ncbi:MAG: hypothetical protein H0T93_02000 [Chloroflexia bacterium]|nr:hypothetical protein [Chloroflexia bacterium]
MSNRWQAWEGRGEEVSGGVAHRPDQAAHPSRTAPEAARAAAAFPPLDVAWIPVQMEWSVAEDMVLTLRA